MFHIVCILLRGLTRPQVTNVLAETVYEGYPLFIWHIDE
jgi:hypothetical protein